MDDERARPILQRVLARRDPGSACLRRKAVFLIAQESAAGTEDILLETARNDPDPEVREQAVFWLSQVGYRPGGRRARLDPADVEGPGAPGEGGLRALAARQRAGPARPSAPTPSGPICRSTCARRPSSGSARAAGRRTSAFLRELYGRLKEESLREKVLFSVSQAGGQENARVAARRSRRTRRQPIELRKQALFWAGQSDASRSRT